MCSKKNCVTSRSEIKGTSSCNCARVAKKTVRVLYQVKARNHLIKHCCGLQLTQHCLAGGGGPNTRVRTTSKLGGVAGDIYMS